MNSPNHHSKTLHTDASFKGMAKILQTELTTSSPLFRKISDELKTKDSISYEHSSRNYSQHSKPPMKDVSPKLLPPPPSTPTRIRPSSVTVNDPKTWYQFEPSIPFPAQTLPQKPSNKPIDKGACDVKTLQDEMATLRMELAAMSDIMREGDEWLQRSSAEVKELAREQKKFESLTSQQFKNSNNLAQKRLSSPVNGYHMKQISPPPLPKSPRPNSNPVIQSSPIKNNTFPPTPPPQTTTSLKYENGIGLIENGYRRDLAPPTSQSPPPKPIKTCAPVTKLTDETHPENEIKSDSVKRMSSFFESKPQSTTLDDRRKTITVSEFSTRNLTPRSELSTPSLQRVNKPGKLPPPLSPKPNHDNAFKNGYVTRERPPLSPKPAGMGKTVTANRVQNIVKEQAELLLVQTQKSDPKIIIYPPMPSNQSLSPLPPPPPPIPTPPETVNNPDKATMRPISPSALSPKLSNGTNLN